MRTPAPWSINRSPNGHVYIECKNGAEIARMGSENMLADDSSAKDNTEFIVRACNSHDALVALLADVAERYADMRGDQGLIRSKLSEDIDAALAAAGAT